ncbi:MAG: hypothetical protein NZ602_00375 [Thermoguttaceae bacterium]|nr:hypothetical protein [Thermoguttaceae bacterium]MDW8037020.1 hypothetical protein [Thermoguttaceae bacterium]
MGISGLRKFSRERLIGVGDQTGRFLIIQTQLGISYHFSRVEEQASESTI